MKNFLLPLVAAVFLFMGLVFALSSPADARRGDADHHRYSRAAWSQINEKPAGYHKFRGRESKERWAHSSRSYREHYRGRQYSHLGSYCR